MQNTAEQTTANYFYDGVGKRVKKVIGNQETYFVYDAFGKLVAEYTTNQAVTTEGTKYLTTDALGTPRIITNAIGGVVARHDYMPFGEEIASGIGGRTQPQGYLTTNDGIRQQFTGYERDIESGLDFAQNRYFSSKHGRFTSVDPLAASASIKNPQTLNRYSYAINSPYKFTDPLGLAPTQHCWAGICNTYDADEQADSGATSERQHASDSKPDKGVNKIVDMILNDEDVDGWLSLPETVRNPSSLLFPDTQPLPSFQAIWDNHNGKKPTYFDPKTKVAPKHQCAINMSAALQLAGLNMSSYTGTTVEQEINGTIYKLATDVYELGNWLMANFSGTSYPNKNWSKELKGENEYVSDIVGRRGIVIIWDCWKNESGVIRGHVDVWNGYKMRRAGDEDSGLIYVGKFFYFIPLK